MDFRNREFTNSSEKIGIHLEELLELEGFFTAYANRPKKQAVRYTVVIQVVYWSGVVILLTFSLYLFVVSNLRWFG